MKRLIDMWKMGQEAHANYMRLHRELQASAAQIDKALQAAGFGPVL